jgi:hypothetical protein
MVTVVLFAAQSGVQAGLPVLIGLNWAAHKNICIELSTQLQSVSHFRVRGGLRSATCL